MCHSRDLTDEQWKTLDPLIPKPRTRSDGRGRPWKSRRSVINGILWILRTGAPWADLPDRYPSYQTCHRRFQQWVRSGVLRSILEILAQANPCSGVEFPVGVKGLFRPHYISWSEQQWIEAAAPV